MVKKKKNKILILVMVVVLLALIFAGIVVGGFISGKLSNMNIKGVNKSDLAVNDDLYNSISDNMTESEFKNIKTIVLFGIDTQSIDDGQDEEDFLGRTDTIMIASINTEKKTIKLISIPRDTYAEIEGHGKMKVNYAYSFGQEQLAIKTINQNFGLNLTEYITIDFVGLVHVINDIGGIELKITKEEEKYINGASKLAYGVSGNKIKYLTSYGTVTLDGEQALTHSRNRKVGDDFTRAGRQRQVLEAIMSKIFKMDAGEISDTIDVFLKEVTTNINFAEYMGILSDILLNKSTYFSNITSAQVPTREYAKDTYIDGIYYFVPDDPEMLKEKMLDYLYRE